MPVERGPQQPNITFWGAAESVTGSMHLVEVRGAHILLDCGKFRAGFGQRDSGCVSFPFTPAEIDAVVLSHAHVDHCGNLPALVRQGFTGPIYCTPATRELIALMLGDAARIQEEDERVADIVGGTAVQAAPRAGRYVEQTLAQCVTVPYGRPLAITPHVELQLEEAGHILGSALVSLTLAGLQRDVRLTFTGDIGRRGLPFLHDTAPVPACDLLVCESTYGGRTHQTVATLAETFARVVRRSAAERGVVLVPAFSLGRTQLVVHYLLKWMREGLMPTLPVFVDSPLAADIADVHTAHPEAFHEPLAPDEQQAHYLRSTSESDDLVEREGPCVIVASGGMCEGGRIVKHLRRHVDDPRASLVLVSYQAPGSLGRQLLEKRPTVRFHGRKWNKWIEVVELNGFSGHADRDDFLAYLKPLAGRTAKVRLVHGEPEQSWALADALDNIGFDDIDVPARGDTAEIT
jgi:metallo-beta-lactamase family protein